MNLKSICILLISCLILNFSFGQNFSCNNRNKNFQAMSTAPANFRSDTIDILHTEINLEITDFTNKIIKGYCKIKFVPKVNNQSSVRFDLLKLTIDSIKQNSASLTYTYNDTLITSYLSQTANSNDTIEISIFYHGTPQKDVSGIGGFDFSAGYAYNFGVGFDADPHNYGRVWFPCFDNFAEKCTFEFKIGTNNGKIAFCNGELISDSTDTNGIRWRRWQMNKPINSYLASVAVFNYTQVNQTFNSINGTIPVTLAVAASDSVALKNSFVHLQDAFSCYETNYGPYVWNKVGYSMVPFSSGAMEHATNITYPKAAANGTTAYEDVLMAHELAHHWWGDLVTCETAEDMWINEGMASFSAFLFNEQVYGKSRYLGNVKDNHDGLLLGVHLKEKGFRAISGVPHQYTYGDHVYNKGADVAHTMRAYLGDSLFFSGLKYVMNQKKYLNLNSNEFGNLLSTSTGINMGHFFNDWVLNGGWPHFSIDSINTVPSGSTYDCKVYAKQKLFGAPNFYTKVPLEITFYDANWNKTVKQITFSGQFTDSVFNLNFTPIYAAMNMESKISDAISSEYRTIKNTGVINFRNPRLELTVQSVGQDSSLIRIEHNFAKPDSVKNNNNNYKLTTRYWKIDGIFSQGFHSKAKIYFDGRKAISTSPGVTTYLDTTLTIFNCDSIILLYRKNTADDWKEVQHYSKTKLGGANSKYGFMIIDSLFKGEYTFANGVSTVLSVNNLNEDDKTIRVYPNPTNDIINISIPENKVQNFEFELYTSIGEKCSSGKLFSGDNSLSIKRFKNGIYFLKLKSKGEVIRIEKIILQ